MVRVVSSANVQFEESGEKKEIHVKQEGRNPETITTSEFEAAPGWRLPEALFMVFELDAKSVRINLVDHYKR